MLTCNTEVIVRRGRGIRFFQISTRSHDFTRILVISRYVSVESDVSFSLCEKHSSQDIYEITGYAFVTQVRL